MSQLGKKNLYIYQIQVVVFEIFKIGQEKKKLAPIVPKWASSWGYSLGAQGFLEVVRSAQWVNLVTKKLYIHQI